MGTLAEIEAAAEQLTLEQKRELFLFLAKHLKSTADREAPEPRQFPRRRIEEWIADDERGMRRLQEGD